MDGLTHTLSQKQWEKCCWGTSKIKTPLALVIIRPTIITSTFKEPFPGWLEGLSERPWINKDGKAVVVRKGTELGTVAKVQRYMELHYLIPLKILSVVNIASCQYFRGTYVDLARKVKFLMRLVELFTPYVFFKGVFDDTNTERLRRWAERENDNEMLNFDPKSINWDDYFMYTHIAGVVKYAFTR
ncbi:UNVERIFIED_CONTAM: Fatty acyl-CoA reductase 3 [Sesamum calycinum]|uniref:Fatty acyl-CoA reductase 3 n=1 Tax=Sesamum calycinum TaxID=2727403 RepID=A0AAW2SBZ4_9LAMI